MWDLVVSNLPWIFSGIGVVAVLAISRAARQFTLMPLVRGTGRILRLVRGLLWSDSELNGKVELDVRPRGCPLEIWLDETPHADIWVTITNHSPLDLTITSLSAEWSYGGVSTKAVDSEPDLVVRAHTSSSPFKTRVDLTDAQANRIAQSAARGEGRVQIRAKAAQGWRSWALCSGDLEGVPARLVNAQGRVPDQPKERI